MIEIKNTRTISEIPVDKMPRSRDLTQPLSPRVTRNTKKLLINTIDSDLCIPVKYSGTWLVLLELRRVILDAVRVHARTHNRSPDIEITERPISQSIILLLTELMRRVPRKAKENPATSALIKAPCLHISA